MVNNKDIYNNFKILKDDNIYTHFKYDNGINPSPFPLRHVIFFLTSRCNHNCSFCFFGKSNSFIDNNIKCDFDDSLIDNLINSLNNLCVKAVTLTGGEPTLYHKLEYVIQELHNLNIYVGLITNGEKIGIINEVMPYINWIRISMNGSLPDSYGKYHGVKNKIFNDIISNIEKITRYDNCTIGVSFLFLPDNYNNMDHFVKLIKSIGVDNIRLGLPTSHHKDFFSIKELQKISQITNKLKEKYEENDFAVYNNTISLFDSIEHPIQDYQHCYIKDVSTVVDCDGNVYMCCVLKGNKNSLLGNVYNNSLEYIWKDNNTQKFLRNHNPRQVCNVKCFHYEQNKLFNYLFNKEMNIHDYFI